RERVAAMYLEIGRVRRLAAALAMLAAPEERRAADVNEIVERALMLARHRFAGDADALLGLGTAPPALVDSPPTVPAGARPTAAAGGAVTIRTWASATEVTVVVETSGAGATPRFLDAIRAAVAAEGGRLELGPSGFAATLALPHPDALR